MMKKGMLYAATLLVLTGCNGSDQQAEAEKQLTAIEKGQVTATAQVVMKSVDDELILNGDVMCDESLMRKLFVPCTGKVSGLRVEVGDRVSKGQRLATVHSEGAADYRKSMDEADTELRLAQRQLDMQTDMHQSGMASDKELEEARERVRIAKAERQRLQDVAAINGYNGQSNASLVAPISGYVIQKRIYNDTYVSDDNNDEAALEIADLRKVWIVADVYESDIAKVHQGAAATVTTMAYPDQQYQGKIDKIYSVLDSESKTMKVRVSLDNPEGLLKPGMFASVHVSLSARGQQMPAVPSEAVIFEGGHDYVMVDMGEDHYQCRKVTVAHADGEYSYMSHGLRVGEKVVVKNALLYFNAAKQ